MTKINFFSLARFSCKFKRGLSSNEPNWFVAKNGRMFLSDFIKTFLLRMKPCTASCSPTPPHPHQRSHTALHFSYDQLFIWGLLVEPESGDDREVGFAELLNIWNASHNMYFLPHPSSPPQSPTPASVSHFAKFLVRLQIRLKTTADDEQRSERFLFHCK